MNSPLQDAALKMAIEQALHKQSRELKKDIIRWFLYKQQSDAYIDQSQINELASFSIEEILENVYDR